MARVYCRDLIQALSGLVDQRIGFGEREAVAF